MSYLDRLRALEGGDLASTGPTKPTKVAFVASVGGPPTHSKNIEDAKPQLGGVDRAAEDRRSRVMEMLAEREALHYAVVVDEVAEKRPPSSWRLQFVG